jgi:hypothetical protein
MNSGVVAQSICASFLGGSYSDWISEGAGCCLMLGWYEDSAKTLFDWYADGITEGKI